MGGNCPGFSVLFANCLNSRVFGCGGFFVCVCGGVSFPSLNLSCTCALLAYVSYLAVADSTVSLLEAPF